MPAPTRWRHAPQAVAAPVGDAGLLLTPDFRYVEVDAVGLQIWDAIAGGASVGEVAVTLTDHFDVDPARAQQDVSDFLGQLADLGLVVSFPEPGED